MRRISQLEHRFVHFIPEVIEEGVLYISIEFATTAHKCCCGCGEEVVVVLSPTDWSLNFNGASVSLDPSIGNWSFKCRSHYWIRRNRVLWARAWTPEEIKRGRVFDEQRKQHHFSGEASDDADFDTDADDPIAPDNQPSRRSW